MAYAVFPVLLCLETERILINFIVHLSGRKYLYGKKVSFTINNTRIALQEHVNKNRSENYRSRSAKIRFYKLRGENICQQQITSHLKKIQKTSGDSPLIRKCGGSVFRRSGFHISSESGTGDTWR